jgi:hypothetical protein
MSQWTYGLDQCGTCHLYPGCESRKRILAALSEKTHELNASESVVAGAIFVQCRRGNVAPMCTASMSQCAGCPFGEGCPDRAALQSALSDLCQELNAATDAVGAVTNIIVNCQRQ